MFVILEPPAGTYKTGVYVYSTSGAFEHSFMASDTNVLAMEVVSGYVLTYANDHVAPFCLVIMLANLYLEHENCLYMQSASMDL